MGRFDLSFKSLSDGKNWTLLRLFGSTPIDAATRVEPLERELAMAIKSVDQAYLLERGGERWVEHLEAELVLTKDDLEAILERAALLSINKRAPVRTAIVLLSRRHAGKAEPPEVYISDRGSLQLSMRPRVLKLWEMPARLVLDGPDMEAWPLTGAMAAAHGELDEAIKRLAAIEDGEQRSRLAAEMVTWSCLNYNKEVVDGIRARFNMVSTKEVLLATPVGEELVEYGRREGRELGREEGREKGREEGRLIEARQNLLLIAASRFPGLIDSAVADSLSGLTQVQGLTRALVAADSLEQARAAVSRTLDRQT